ncbi:hypothetical protein JCM9492_11410 [Aquifex pyrophilus]
MRGTKTTGLNFNFIPSPTEKGRGTVIINGKAYPAFVSSWEEEQDGFILREGYIYETEHFTITTEIVDGKERVVSFRGKDRLKEASRIARIGFRYYNTALELLEKNPEEAYSYFCRAEEFLTLALQHLAHSGLEEHSLYKAVYKALEDLAGRTAR